MRLALFSIEGEHPRSRSAIARRFILWSLVCWISGGPSFLWAILAGSSNSPDTPLATGISFDPWAMGLAIMLFAAGYTALTSTDRFDQFQRRPGMRLTLYIGYFTRLALSIAIPISMWADVLPGLLSVTGTQVLFEIMGMDPRDSQSIAFAYTFVTTCVQGFFLNVILSIYMVIVYLIVRLIRRGRAEPRGFEVIPTEPLPVARTDAADAPALSPEKI